MRTTTTGREIGLFRNKTDESWNKKITVLKNRQKKCCQSESFGLPTEPEIVGKSYSHVVED